MQMREMTPVQDSLRKENAPVITKWKGEPMIRLHSIRAAVKEILQMANTLDVITDDNISQGLDVVKIGIIGEPSTGKTTLANTLGHLIHKMSSVPFAVRAFGEKEFLDFENTLAKLAPANYVLKFGDLSFLSEKKQIDKVKQVITKIRHLPGGKDVKIILIYDYHYTLGLDKYLRQSNFKFFTSMGSSEMENIQKIVGTKYNSRIEEFAKICHEATTKKKVTFRVGTNNYFIYPWRKPFNPVLLWNSAKLRYVAYPIRTWIDPICTTCTEGDNRTAEAQVPVEQFIKESEGKFGPGIFQAAVKLKMFSNGINVYSRKVSQAVSYLDRALEIKIIPLDKLVVAYGLTVSKTKLRKKLDGVLLD